MRKYHTLVVREDGTWSPQFGDYDRGLVTAELREYMRDHGRNDLAVIETGEGQASIDAEVARLNDWRKT